MIDFENLKRDCVDTVEQSFFKKFAINSQNRKQFYKDLYEACIMDVICTFEDLDISSVVKREEPDFVLECGNDVLAVEIRKVECKENDIDYESLKNVIETKSYECLQVVQVWINSRYE